MANEKGMSEDKKARLEAIRAANAAKKAQAGADEPQPATTAAITDAPPAAAATPATAVGSSMSDDKKAKLEAIRAANAAKKAQAGDGAPAATAAPAAAAPATPAAARPAAAAPAAAAPAPRPAARPTSQPAVLEDDRIPMQVYIRRAGVGAIGGLILCVMLATMTGNYITGAIWGLGLGALTGILVLNWPPERTTGE